MASSHQWASLHVEGVDDQHTLLHLLERHGLRAHYERELLLWRVEGGPAFFQSGSVERLLDGMAQAIRFNNHRPVGFVLDADDRTSGAGLAARWRSVSDRLRNLGLTPPHEPTAGGLILDVPRYKTVVGVWLMPDNQSDGALEDFLRELVDRNDGQINYARHAARHAKKLGALFRDVDLMKAQLHTWLAWQTKPGLPYGSAVKAHYFGYNSPAALTFVAWFKTLYGIS